MDEKTLVQYREIQREIAQIEKQIDRLENLAKSPRISNITGMPRAGRVSDGMDIVAKIEDLKTDYYAKLSQFLELQKVAEKIIAGLDPDARIIIRYKYIDGFTNDKIADRVGWSQSTVKRRIKSAMEKMKGE